jgi:hypothetical protein
MQGKFPTHIGEYVNEKFLVQKTRSDKIEEAPYAEIEWSLIGRSKRKNE